MLRVLRGAILGLSFLVVWSLSNLFSVVGAQQSRGHVLFAEPEDPVFLALYPTLSSVTGLTPVAEPAVAVGRRAPRSPGQGKCEPGFRISEPQRKEWSYGGTGFLLTAFFVTTDNKRGIAAPCYRPEPWVCVLERKPNASFEPVDCGRVEQRIVFPNEPSLDTAPFHSNETERAFGLRMRNTTGYRLSSETDETLILFRFHDKRLSQILAVPIARSEDDYTKEGGCSRELILDVGKTKTRGFFDWSIRVGKKTGREPCEIDSAGTYRWDGTRYVKAPGG